MAPPSSRAPSAPPDPASAPESPLPGQHVARAACCPLYHQAIELIGKRWTGAIMQVLLDGPMRFSQIAHAVPELSDRLLSERMKELEGRGLVERREIPGSAGRLEYSLTPMGRDLGPALGEIKAWAHRWLSAG